MTEERKNFSAASAPRPSRRSATRAKAEQRGHLQGDHQGGEVPGGGQQGGAGGAGEQQEPVLAAGQPRGGAVVRCRAVHGVHREQRGDQRAAEREQLEDQREVVRDVGAAGVPHAEGAPGRAAGEREQGEQREGEAAHGQGAEQLAVARGQEEVGDQHREGGQRGDQRGRDRHPVHGLDQAARVGYGEGGHSGLPRGVRSECGELGSEHVSHPRGGA